MGIIMKKSLFLLVTFFTCFLSLYSSESKPSLLIIHSYSSSFCWTDKINQGIITTLQEYNPDTVCHFMFLDSFFFSKEEYMSSAYKEIRYKYGDINFDGIITSDNSAYDFVKTYGNELFPHTPIVSCGINGPTPHITQHPNIVPIMENPNHSRTLMEALQYRPGLKRINVIVDSSSMGEIFLQEFNIKVRKMSEDLKFNYIRDKSFDDLQKIVSELPSDELIYLLPYYRDSEDKGFFPHKAEAVLSKASSVPILVSWHYQLGTGVLGGSFHDPCNIGRNAAEILLNELTGQKINGIYSSSYENCKSVYDYSVMQRFNINKDELPLNAQIINDELSFYEQHRRHLFHIIIIIISPFILSLFLFLRTKHQRIINEKNEELLVLKTDYINSQAEIIHTLGEIIEKRSNETGGHVKRVAKLSYFLAIKIGMSKREAEMLEVISPLHDIGKIGIAEKILDKPGKLTKKEYEIVKTHTIIGRDILSESNSTLLSHAREIACSHHEQWNGKGYPEGLKEDKIPLYARITMIADVYDALSTDRTYKKKWKQSTVLEYFKNNSGIMFDPWLTRVFVDNIEEVKNIYYEMNDIKLIS